MPPDAARLKRWAPKLLFDSVEAFFADHPAQMLVNPHNTLQRGNGNVLAVATPDGHHPQLDYQGAAGAGRLLLGAGHYSDGEAYQNGDRLSIAGKDYRTQYVALRTARPELKNKIVAREARDPHSGTLWLQYWFWYFYNDYHLAANFGLHEGDWEMIQLRMAGDAPDLAVYAQHGNAQQKPWAQVSKQGDTPLVYSARGSHASYFEAGLHSTGVWFDVGDGTRFGHGVEVIVLDDAALPGWAAWPGKWGDTPGGIPGIESSSPPGPIGHAQWSDPQSLLGKAAVAVAAAAPPAPPPVAVTRVADHVALKYDFSGLSEDQRPAVVTVNVNSPEVATEPPRTFTFNVEDQVAGDISTSIALAPGKEYDVHVATTSRDGVPSAAEELPPV
jgi:hypothetical protein